MFNRSPLFSFLAFISAIKRELPEEKSERKNCFAEKSLHHFVLIHSKPFDETDKDFIAQHMYCIHYTRLRTSRRATDFDMPFICNTHVFEFILSIQSPWIKRGFILYPEKVNFLGLRLYMHLHMRLRTKMNALHSMRMNY
jgi:hypothetical protein